MFNKKNLCRNYAWPISGLSKIVRMASLKRVFMLYQSVMFSNSMDNISDIYRVFAVLFLSKSWLEFVTWNHGRKVPKSRRFHGWKMSDLVAVFFVKSMVTLLLFNSPKAGSSLSPSSGCTWPSYQRNKRRLCCSFHLQKLARVCHLKMAEMCPRVAVFMVEKCPT